MLNKIIQFFLTNRVVTFLLLLLLVGWGLALSPFNWDMGNFPRDPVAVDAIPDIGENQQIVFTKWEGRSPQDVEDQITYPLTTALLGIPGVETVRSNSMFGFSSIYVIFKDDVEFYWSRSRILEKLNSLPESTLPQGVQPSLGPDATALGQIYWYTLEGRDKNGNPTGGWDPQELRSIQDYHVRYALASAEGVSEVASIGGYVKEYQVDVDPSALKVHGISLQQVITAVQQSNRDVGARTMEVNNVEYLVRGLGYIENIEDLENAVITQENNTPLKIKDVANVTTGPAQRRGILDKSGAEAVGGVVVARYGSNPLEVINNVKDKIKDIEDGMPSKTLEDGTESKVEVVPFYDRTELIHETIGTLEEALSLEILITLIVVIILVMNLRASVLISGVLPIAVLMTFIAMKYMDVTANIVALSGIAIAIGTMVDMAVVLVENIVRHMENARPDEKLKDIIFRASSEVSSAILTAVLTTIISFIPVFSMQGAEGKLFGPLAFTKTFALVAALIVTLILIPTIAYWIFGLKVRRKVVRTVLNSILVLSGIILIFISGHWGAWVLLLIGILNLVSVYVHKPKLFRILNNAVFVFAIGFLLSREWLPLGPGKSLFTNMVFLFLVTGGLLLLFAVVIKYYQPILRYLLHNKKTFLLIPALILLLGINIWLGFDKVFNFAAKGFDKINVNIRTTSVWSGLTHTFPGVSKEFMPSLDEGSFLLMPTSMPHSGVEANKEYLQKLDMAVSAIPEVKTVVGKAGRVESPLDPAPMSMFENVILYKSEYKLDEDGHRIRFAVDDEGDFLRNDDGELIPDRNGRYFRQWRDHIKTKDDIWDEIVSVTKLPGVTSAPKLQPIETRLVMLQTGMRAPMGIQVYGQDLEQIDEFGKELENHLQQVPALKKQSVFADRVVGKPYLQLDLNRDKMARYGITVGKLQNYIEVALGGIPLTQTVEGRERYPVRIRYPREVRDNPGELADMMVPVNESLSLPLGDLVNITYHRGPQSIKSENSFLTSYVIFDRKDGISEIDAVERAKSFLQDKIDKGELVVPEGVNYEFTGNYENQVRAEKRLSIIIPIVLIVVFVILYLQFSSVATSLMVFSGIAVAFSGGFLLIWLYGQPWFLDFTVFGTNMRDLFQISTVNLSVAVWVGFIALFGIATDDGVVMATYLRQVFRKSKPTTKKEIHESVILAGSRRVRPCLMTTATTLLALMPILTSTGRGSDVMVPMAIPAFGGMLIELVTLFVVPVLYAMWQERELKGGQS
ncbi:MAG: efflux RND transporter permease subunit [Bacteroidales bacterium]|nr:efflux RND transporter permease subunit [Bacteroidales bacterium]MCF8327468.1 efflux RND transporter permease subunit [Bacteroidales bacterium]